MPHSKVAFIEPFQQFKKIKLETEILAEKGKAEGKQKKGAWAGFYKNKSGEMFYIKKSKEFSADNLSEVVTSDLLGRAIDEHAVPYEFVAATRSESGDDDSTPQISEGDKDYVVSPCRKGFITLKDAVLKKFPDGLSWLAVGANIISDANKDKLYNCLSSKQRAQLALILAGCALVLERDCQYGNIFFYTPEKSSVKQPDEEEYVSEEEEQENKNVGKFDHGWGLAGICLPENARVDIFSRRFYMKSREGEGTGVGRDFPTNHFNDFPRIIHSHYFIDGLKKVINHSKRNMQITQVGAALQKIRLHFKDEKVVKQKLIHFAEHIGLLTALKLKKPKLIDEKNFKNKNSHAMEKFIIHKLSESLNHRTESLTTLRSLLRLEVYYQPMADKSPHLKAYKSYIKKYNPEIDLETLKNHCLKIIHQLQDEHSNKGSKQPGKKLTINFENIAEKLPAFDNLKTFIASAIKKYRENTPNPNKILIRFFENLLEHPERLLSGSSVSKATSQLQLFSSYRKSSESREIDNSATAEAENQSYHSIEKIAENVIKIMENDATIQHKISYKKLHLTKEHNDVILRVDEDDSVLLRTEGNKIIVEAKPILGMANSNQAIELQNKLFARVLVETRDPSPLITKGNPEQVIAILEAIREIDNKIKPRIHSSIQFTAEQEKRLKNQVLKFN